MQELTTTNDQERKVSAAAHLSTLLGYLIPLANIIAPLIIMLMKKQESAYIGYHAREALNFQISILFYVLICIPFVFIGIGVIMLVAVAIFDLIMVIVATIKANDGESYRYPYTIRLIK